MIVADQLSYGPKYYSKYKTLVEQLQEHIRDYDLVHLYGLHQELRRTIFNIANYISSGQAGPLGEDIFYLLEDLNDNFSEIEKVLDYNALFVEIATAKANFNSSKRCGIEISSMMKVLVVLEKAVQAQIENQKYDYWRVKPESFLESYILSCPEYGDEEAIVYLLSRGKYCGNSLDQIHTRWQNDCEEDGVPDYCKPNSSFISMIGCRVTDWAIIDTPSWLRRMVHEDIEALTFGCLESIETLFSLFTSKFAIDTMGWKLDQALCEYQNIIRKPVEHKNYSDFEENIIKENHAINLAATYVFGCYQTKTNSIDSLFLEKVVDFLLNSQNPSASWWRGGVSLPDHSISQAAMVIHALALAQRNGTDCKNVLGRAKDWLINKQNAYGVWQECEDPVGLTVRVLDAIELAEGGTQVAFTLPKVKSNAAPSLSANTGQQCSKEEVDTKDESEGFFIDKIKELARKAENPLLDDKINQALFIKYAKFQEGRDTKPHTRPPSYHNLAKMLHEKRLTPIQYSKSAIKKRVDKLVKEGLIENPYAERRRKSKERSWDIKQLDDLGEGADI